MTTYPITIYASKITKMMPISGFQDEISMAVECSDIEELFEQVTSDVLGNELFKYLKEHHDKDELREALCI